MKRNGTEYKKYKEVITWLQNLNPSKQLPYIAIEKNDYFVYSNGTFRIKVVNSIESIKSILRRANVKIVRQTEV